jgi:hypothetical protein
MLRWDGTNDALSPKQKAAIAALLMAGTVRPAAKMCKVNERTQQTLLRLAESCAGRNSPAGRIGGKMKVRARVRRLCGVLVVEVHLFGCAVRVVLA